MNWFAQACVRFFVDNFPSLHAIFVGGPPALAWSFVCLWLAGHLKQKGVRTGYTRKIYHFLMFGTAAWIQWQFGTPAACLFGAMCTVVVFFAVVRGPGNLLYEAMARERDEPHRTFFIVIPYLATVAGALIDNILFGSFAITGYLVTGLGDAIGEPVGTRFGKHSYRVFSLSSVPTTRSVEGSLAVFTMSVLALVLANAAFALTAPGASGILKLLAIAAACTLTEAFSPHGWDNATMQFVPTALISIW